MTLKNQDHLCFEKKSTLAQKYHHLNWFQNYFQEHGCLIKHQCCMSKVLHSVLKGKRLVAVQFKNKSFLCCFMFGALTRQMKKSFLCCFVFVALFQRNLTRQMNILNSLILCHHNKRYLYLWRALYLKLVIWTPGRYLFIYLFGANQKEH